MNERYGCAEELARLLPRQDVGGVGDLDEPRVGQPRDVRLVHGRWGGLIELAGDEQHRRAHALERDRHLDQRPALRRIPLRPIRGQQRDELLELLWMTFPERWRETVRRDRFGDRG